MKPDVSVILPYYEGQNWVVRSIASVQQQKGVSWELIIVDDESVFPLSEITERFYDEDIITCRIKHSGKGVALNKGIAEAHSEIVCFIDQDDIMLPGRLEKQVRIFENEPSTDVVYSDYERVFDDGRVIDQFISYQASPKECLHSIAKGASPISMQTIMIRKTTVDEVGGFCEDPRLAGLDDLEFLVRLCVSTAVMAYEPGLVQQWVRHSGNFSYSGRFDKARLFALDRISELSARYPMIRKELPYFRYHAFCMRGLHRLENRMGGKAYVEFLKAIRARPCNWNGYYLLLKSFLKL